MYESRGGGRAPACLSATLARQVVKISSIGLNVKTFQNKHHIKTVHTIHSAVLGSGIRIAEAALWKENTSAQNGLLFVVLEHIVGDDLFLCSARELTP